MASECTTKVRLVRCPKCRLVLPELPEFNVYKCGGCGATLQAKSRVTRSTATSLNVADAVQGNQTGRVFEDKEPESGKKEVLRGPGECSSSQNNEWDQSRSKEFDGEQGGVVNLPSEKQNNGTHQFSESSDCDVDGSEASNEVVSPMEFVDSKNEEFVRQEEEESPNNKKETFARNENEEVQQNENRELADNGDRIFHNEIEECDDSGNGELFHRKIEKFARNESEELAHNEGEEFPRNESEEFAHNESEDLTYNENKKFTPEVARNEIEQFSQKQNDEFTQNQTENFSQKESLGLVGVDVDVTVNGESTPSADTSKKIGSDSNIRNYIAVNYGATAENGSRPNHTAVRERIASDSVVSSPSKLKPPRRSVQHGYDHPRSEEFDPSSELSVQHAYESSISSYDGMDERFPNRHFHSFENSYKAENFRHSGERSRGDKFLAQPMMNSDSKLQHPARPSWSDKSHSVNNRQWGRDEFVEPARHDRSVRNWTLERHEHHPPSSVFERINRRTSYQNGRPSGQLHGEFHRNSSFQSHEWSEDPEQIKLKLLALVFDQLNKTHLHDKENEGISGLPSNTRYNPRYNNYEAPMEERLNPPNYRRYPGGYSTGSNSSYRRRFKKIPFSGEATSSSSHQFDPSCAHCCPPNWQRSAQLPPPSHYNSSGPCRVHPGHSYCTCCSSCPASPQWSMDSEYPPWGREMQSDDQRRRSQDMTNYLREKQRPAKRHFRPLAGGAPIMVCYKCSKILQIPADFLLFKKKCHRLRCGACSEVLKFSLHKGSHIVPCEASTVDPPPPSEAEDYGDDIDRRSMASSSQTPLTGPATCSEDCGLSCSTTPFHTPNGSTVDRRMSLDSFDLSRDRVEFIPTQSQGKNKSKYELSGPSPNIPRSQNFSSEIEELPQRSTSPLHRLMGYSSPSDVIFGSVTSGRGTSTSYSMLKENRAKN
ncbi:uncharacterized protein LOC115705376 [Cannabis sativa]|uniref:Zinc-ribbon domain-containing protein n=1 Tax=Cannabis sativa TaxID=3483 RepID=A0A7J6EWR6_CANSA|nr:uncharacterized protein LOC115705376 [Cannabis sativa]XP_030488565.2 uncharacterized protein LOC115705376 [Cannabis sativa]XP_060958088.1 uncharacterized protein LOC115705376 [Cannabis sativa]KAF4362861.1 hypothetical protein G4B88_014198 [Cannabis sativa]